MSYRYRKHGNREEDALSPVIGTILMVAVTVVLAATVFVAVNGFGDDGVSPPTNAVFKAQAIDTDANGSSDRIKITYLTGPSNVLSTDVVVTVKDANGNVLTQVGGNKTSNWSPGDFVLYDPPGSGAHFVTVSMYGSTLVDRDLNVRE